MNRFSHTTYLHFSVSSDFSVVNKPNFGCIFSLGLMKRFLDQVD